MRVKHGAALVLSLAACSRVVAVAPDASVDAPVVGDALSRDAPPPDAPPPPTYSGHT